MAVRQVPNSSVSSVLMVMLYLLAWIGALFSLGLGITVIVGWYTHNVSLIQILPQLVPMQYNTAVGFILIGLALIFSLVNRPRMASVLGALAFLLGFLTLIQYLFFINIGIDELFM